MNVTAASSISLPARIAAYRAAMAASSESQAESSASTVVTLSAEGRQAAQEAESATPTGLASLASQVLLPTPENVAKLAQTAGEMIGAKLDAAGISRSPGFELTIDDVNSAHVTVKSDRSDAKAIEDLINSDPKLQLAVHNTYALASHIPALKRSAEFSQAYTAAQSQAEIDQVLARYSDLLSGIQPKADIGLSFGKNGLTATINGETALA